MENDKIEFIKRIFQEENEAVTLHNISKINDTEILFAYAQNYNWDDGFKIPEQILKNKQCDFSTALLIFYGADGFQMLSEKESFLNSDLIDWKNFLLNLYENLIRPVQVSEQLY